MINLAETKYKLTREKSISIGKGALIAGLGAILTYLTAELANLDFGELTPLVVMVWSIAVNAIRKFIGEE